MGRKNRANERLGYCGVNNQGSKFRVVHYKDSKNVYVEFYNHPRERITIVKARWRSIQKKEVTDIFQPSVYGVGYLGKTSCMNNDGTLKKSYRRWVGMLARCYDSKLHLKHPTYVGCSVCEEWKCFATFEKDYEILLNENNFPKSMELHLDKDILFKGNKVYSKEKCVLVPSELNKMFTKCDMSRGNLPIGVFCRKDCRINSYIATVSTGLKARIHKKPYQQTKFFPTVEEAFQFYKQQKEHFIELMAVRYRARGYISENSRLFRALMSYKVEVDD